MQKLLPTITLPFLLLACTSANPATPSPIKSSLSSSAVKIAAALPPNWRVRLEGDLLYIERNEPAQMISTAPSGPGYGPEGPPKFLEKPTLILISSPAVTSADLAALNKKNADSEKALQMLASQMTDLKNNAKPMGDQGGYRAANPDQQSRLDAYIAVHHALPYQTPPTLFSDDAAFYWSYNNSFAPIDPAVQSELATLTAKINSLFAKSPLK